jgi:hypothetical protein
VIKKVSRQDIFRFSGLYFFPAFVLFVTTLYASLKASAYYQTNSDALIYRYIYGSSRGLHNIVLPNQHPNLLKAGLFELQSLLPFDHFTFTAATLGLVFITLFGWLFLTTYLVGRRYFILLCGLLSVVVVSAPLFVVDLAETTIRNVEFPIALCFIILCSKLLSAPRDYKFSKSFKLLAVIVSIFYCLTLSGDNYFEFTVTIPILISLLVYWLRLHVVNKRLLQTAGLVIGLSAVAVLFKALVNKIGLIVLNNTVSNPHTTIVSPHELSPSITLALQQLLNLEGANIFGIDLRLRQALTFVNLLLLVIGTYGLVKLLGYNQKRSGKAIAPTEKSFASFILAICFFMTFIVYILADQVVQVGSNGTITSLLQDRYLTFMPLILIIGVCWVAKNGLFWVPRLRVLSYVILLLCMILFIPNMRSAYNSEVASSRPDESELITLSSYLKSQNVHQILSNYWYGPPIDYFSGNKITFSPVFACNVAYYFNVQKDWYKPSPNITKSALVIDRPDQTFWPCSSSTLTGIYGKPASEKTFKDLISGQNIEVWIYNYDTRTRLAAMPNFKN